MAALEKAETHILEEKDTQINLCSGMSAITEQFYLSLLRNEFQGADIDEKLESLDVREKSASVLLISYDDRYRLQSEKSEQEYRRLCMDLKQRLKTFLEREIQQDIPVLHLDYLECVVVRFASLQPEAKKLAELVL